MAEVLLPPWIIPEQESHEWLDEGSSVFPAAFAPGIAQRQSFGGLRLKMSRRHTVRAEEKAQLLSVLQATRGRFNALRTKVHFAPRGSFPATELLSNNTFASGTTGWSAGADASISAQDRVLRVLRVANASDGAAFATAPTVSTVQYAPYMWRIFVSAVRGTVNAGATVGGNAVAVSGSSLADVSASLGLSTVPFLATATSGVSCFADNLGALASVAGEYYDVSYASLSRCGLVDNGANMLLRSDEFGNASWTKSACSVGADAATAPDGTSTADSIIEDGTTAFHYAQQGLTVPSSAADYCICVAARASTRNFCFISLIESTGPSNITQYFNLTGGGSVGASGSTGSNWTNRRAFTVNLGNTYVLCCLIGRKTNAATSLTVQIGGASADGTGSYLGVNGNPAIVVWRATAAQSSVPTRLVQTTSAASTGISQTGNALYVKGLPASTNGLLLPGDYFEINGEIKQTTAALNSDAAQLGYLQFEPALVRSPSDNDPINITDPMGKFLVSNIQVENQFGAQAVVTYDLEHIYE